MSSSDIYANEAKLAGWIEMLMRWMQHKGVWKADRGFHASFWRLFAEEYPSTATDMKKWLEARHDAEN